MNERDKRIQRSKTSLKNAMINLLKKKPYDSISVKDIIDEAGYSRSTFYMHYENKETFMQNIIQSEIDEVCNVRRDMIMNTYSNSSKTQLILVSEVVFSKIYENREIYCLFMTNPAFWNFPDIFVTQLYKDSLSSITVNNRNFLDFEYECYVKTYILFATIKFWIESDFKQSPNYMARVHTLAFLDDGATLKLRDSKNHKFPVLGNQDYKYK